MNTRGLMELIVLNIGLDLGVISPKLFAMMVLMAVVTTMATTPILRFLLPLVSSAAANGQADGIPARDVGGVTHQRPGVEPLRGYRRGHDDRAASRLGRDR